jgi:hypothetical protein
VVAPSSRAIFPDCADIRETGCPGCLLAEMRVQYLAQQIGHAATFALGACLEGLVLPVVEQDLRALHVLHLTHQHAGVKIEGLRLQMLLPCLIKG